MVKISVPGKTFIAGEYIATLGGPALVVTTEPYFETLFEKTKSEMQLVGIHADSPAGKLARQHQAQLANVRVSFIDPYKLGGFGASTAQFLAVYQYCQPGNIVPEDLLAAYRKCAWNGEGLAPSGADLIAQAFGQLTYFHKNKKQLETFAWPFANLDFHLISTGTKLATHTHLQSMKGFRAEHLEKAFAMIEQKDEHLFVKGIRAYAQALAEEGFTAPASLEILTSINKLDNVLAAKACGAMGADVILVLTPKNQSAALDQYLDSKKLKKVASTAQLARGLQQENSSGNEINP